MTIKHKTTGTISLFANTFPNVSNPSVEWLTEQGYEFYTPVPETVPPTPAEIIQQYSDGLTAHVLALCHSRLYDGPQSFKLYTDANPLPDSPTYTIEMAHKTECAIAAEWYPKFWAKATWIMGEVLAGRHDMPESVEALIAELPALEW